MEKKTEWPKIVESYPIDYSCYMPKVTGLSKPTLTKEQLKNVMAYLTATGMPTIFVD